MQTTKTPSDHFGDASAGKHMRKCTNTSPNPVTVHQTCRPLYDQERTQKGHLINAHGRRLCNWGHARCQIEEGRRSATAQSDGPTAAATARSRTTSSVSCHLQGSKMTR